MMMIYTYAYTMYTGGNEGMMAEGDDLSVDLRPSRQGRKRKVMVPGERTINCYPHRHIPYYIIIAIYTIIYSNILYTILLSCYTILICYRSIM